LRVESIGSTYGGVVIVVVIIAVVVVVSFFFVVESFSFSVVVNCRAPADATSSCRA
jgi:hypothetical protein